MEPSGKRIEDLDYEGCSDDEDERLGDEHVEQLACALMKNDTFSGPLNLSKNSLTNQVSYVIFQNSTITFLYFNSLPFI